MGCGHICKEFAGIKAIVSDILSDLHGYDCLILKYSKIILDLNGSYLGRGKGDDQKNDDKYDWPQEFWGQAGKNIFVDLEFDSVFDMICPHKYTKNTWLQIQYK